MKLIEGISIEGLRSIQSQQLAEVGPINAFVGKNSSGKSNALRALNIFFNGAIEPGKEIDFSRDHYEQEPRIRKRKRISVTIDFSLPDNFNLRKGLEPLKALGTEFSISRVWELDPLRRPYEILEARSEGRLIDNGAEIAN